jgi:hypothetical protein
MSALSVFGAGVVFVPGGEHVRYSGDLRRLIGCPAAPLAGAIADALR